MRTVVLRVAALALLLLLALVSTLIIRTLNRLPDSVVYFVRVENGTMTLEGIGRRSGGGDGEARLRQTLEALIAGPTPEEQARGLSSAIPRETRILSLERRDDLVSVDLSKAFEEGGGTAMMTSRLNQLFYTLTQPRGVERVALYIAGERVRVFSGEGLIVANPWRRPPDAPLPRW